MADPGDISGSEIMLTVFLKHDQSKVLEEFQATLDARNWWERFPPEGVEVVSWNVVMGIGQIVTLRLPPDKLQAVNVELERSAWGVFRTETFISYDFMKVRDRLAGESEARRGGG
ncbi:MAG: RidA family protein, partial [Alphaproteobacteria bacterium]|nr:RidA family protein [Alphaproteobacteria bacterium]